MTAPHPEFVAALEKGMTVAFWAKRQPHAPAVVAVTGNRTYGELNARSNQIVRALRAHGIGAGDGVALLCANRTEFVEMFWATRRAGIRTDAGQLASDGRRSRLHRQRLRRQGFHCGYALPGCRRTRGRERAARAAADRDRRRVPGFDSYEGLLRDQDGSDIADPQLGNSMLYTSGTTGKPKGVYRSSAPPTFAAA